MKKIYLLAVAVLFSAMAFSQGVTTSSIGGQVTDNTGEPLPGASVVAIHTPSGTTYGAATDFDGFYRISGMRIGGPYTITISYIGFNDDVSQGIYLNLGQSERISKQMSESATALDEIVVTAQNNGIFDSNKTGASTSIDNRKVTALPNVSRSIADFARLTPQAQIREDNEISIAGQNNRYNALYLDGAVNNDVFGLSGSGTNGGQTGVNPISIDAIESFQVNVAPYDVKLGGFAGGAINAITKSGTNEFKGTAYYLFRNQDLAGKTPGVEEDREKLPEFTAETYGVSIGGPIVKDKLFFFLNYERQDDETPTPFEGVYDGDSGLAGLENFSNFLQSEYGYNPGSFETNTSTLSSDKLTLRLDWNINENHKLSFRNNYVKANNFSVGRSTSTNINFDNGGLDFESISNTASLELNSTFGNNLANNFILGYTRVRDDRNPVGDPFPRIEINDGDSRIFAGSEPFSTANLLNQDIITLTNNLEIYSGRHTVTLGTHNEYSDITNIFFGRNFGEYTYSTLQGFFDDDANEYRSSYSVLGGVGDDSVGAAEFELYQLGFYVQDEVQISDNFKISAGLRFDFPIWDDGRGNTDFNTRGISLLEAAGKDLQGARVGQGPKTSVHISPRLGFNLDVKGNKMTQIRGGLGIFTSRMPLVWPGGAYNNTGNNVANTRIFRPRDAGDPNNVPSFNPDVNTQFREDTPFQGNIDLLAEDLKLPQAFKASLAIDQRLPAGFTISAEILSNTTITGLNVENVNLAGPQFSTSGAGARTNFGGVTLDDTYGGIFLVSNTGEGKSWNTSLTLSKNFYSSLVDVRAQATYSYGDSDVLFDGTSSQIISNWAFNESVNGVNNLTLSTSDFAQGDRYLANVVADFKWSENLKTTIGLFYEGVDGTPFSYVVGNFGSADLIDDSGEAFTALPFIPRNFTEAQLVDDGDLTAEQQWELLDAFISNDDYLSTRRGQFAERNASRARMSHIVDLKLAQDFSFSVKGGKKNTIQISADIFNFTNLINKDWGRRYFTSTFDTASLVNFEGFEADGTTPTYSFNTNIDGALNNIDDGGFLSSRWQAQLGLRYIFN
ncbi:carboxypeptidase regulatory-like domain-containing protein [Croceitalea rosinachiae]|uniref:Carboxypeptidase regulatory-like domain-containing protein n=1 Tax=Croceitalea rosinachiae TaxID=3075596 RepID=A0ABU3A8J3_9FLAO|nr:carboxypeptidase regulatory-like domain-containing protein [Croceitalea sp. F388]MDT0606505.1 carboxypeptidase regulatory-like domain-containing protein [Croceitalea sp. F388]